MDSWMHHAQIMHCQNMYTCRVSFLTVLFFFCGDRDPDDSQVPIRAMVAWGLGRPSVPVPDECYCGWRQTQSCQGSTLSRWSRGNLGPVRNI
jgi:hypothetical protein